jgi:hypothetical protein
MAPCGESSGTLAQGGVTKAFQREEAEPPKSFDTDLTVVFEAFTLGLHAAKPHPYPRVQFMEGLSGRVEPSGKVLGSPPNNSVEAFNDFTVEVVRAVGEFPDFVFEFLHRLGAHAPGTTGKVEAQKGVAFAVRGHFRFLLAELEAQPVFQNLLNPSQCLFRLTPGWAENDEIVSVANKLQAGFFELPIQVIEDDVGQQGRDDPSLGRADVSRHADTVLHDARGKKSFDESENVAIGNFCGDCRHNDAMREVVKEPLDVGIENELETLIVETQSRFQGLMAVAPRAEAVGRVMKQGFKDRRQQAANHLLSHTVFDGWNAEGAKLRFIFGNEGAPQRVGLKRTLFQLPQQSLEILFKVGLEHPNADLVDSRGATIALDGFETVTQQSAGDASGEGVGFDFTLLDHEDSLVLGKPNAAEPVDSAGMFLSERLAARKRIGRARMRLWPAKLTIRDAQAGDTLSVGFAFHSP